MKILSTAEIRKSLESEGMFFSGSTKIVDGRWSPMDAEWNYLDIPHLNFVHSKVESITPIVDHRFTSSILLQRIGPIRIPLVIVLASNPGLNQIYFSTIGPFVLLIESDWSTKSQNCESQVITTYQIGSSRYLRVFHRLIHYFLSKNFEILMQEDVPMREQRGILRRKGFRFKNDVSGYSYLNSLKIGQDNVLRPDLPSARIEIPLKQLDSEPRQFSSVNGLRELLAWRDGDLLFCAPSFCNHEGASLIGEKCSKVGIECPWHGRIIHPIATVALDTGRIIECDFEVIKRVEFENHSIVVEMSPQLKDY